MGYTPPTTAVAAGVIASARWNSEVKGNWEWFVTDAPRCSAVRTSNLNTTTGVNTDVTLPDTEEFDPQGMHSTGAGSEQIIIPAGGGGLYHIICSVSWDNASVTGRRVVNLAVNGAAISGGDSRPADPVSTTSQSFSTYRSLAAADVVKMTALQTSGVTLAISSARLQVRWVSL